MNYINLYQTCTDLIGDLQTVGREREDGDGNGKIMGELVLENTELYSSQF